MSSRKGARSVADLERELSSAKETIRRLTHASMGCVGAVDERVSDAREEARWASATLATLRKDVEDSILALDRERQRIARAKRDGWSGTYEALGDTIGCLRAAVKGDD